MLKDVVGNSDHNEYMYWHYQLGHPHFQKMKRMAKLGFLPKKFSDFDEHCKYKNCMFGRQHQINLQVKEEKKRIFKSSYPC